MRNLKSIWYYFCWVIVEGFPWSNKYLTCICSPREHEGQPRGPGKEHTVHKKRPLPSSRSWPMWRPACTQAIVIQDAKCSGRPEDSKPGSLQVGPTLGLRGRYFQTETWRRWEGCSQTKERNGGKCILGKVKAARSSQICSKCCWTRLSMWWKEAHLEM